MKAINYKSDKTKRKKRHTKPKRIKITRGKSSIKRTVTLGDQTKIVLNMLRELKWPRTERPNVLS